MRGSCMDEERQHPHVSDEFVEWLHELRGHRILSQEQRLREGDMKQAAQLSGAADELYHVIMSLRDHPDGDLPRSDDPEQQESLRALSEWSITAYDASTESVEEPDPEPDGVRYHG